MKPNKRLMPMNILKSYKSTGSLALAKSYLNANGITRATIDRGTLGAGWAVWLGGDDGNGWPTAYRLRNDAKREALEVCKWLELPLFNVKNSGQVVPVPTS